MPVMRGASALVIRCFKRVEYCADVLTGAAGPVFIVLAWLLTGLIGFVFFDVVARGLSWPTTLLLLPAYILVPANLYVQYYLVTHIPGGTPGTTDPRELRWTTPDPHALLAPERWGFRRRGPAPFLPPPKQVRRCRKCDGPKPPRTHHCSVCNRCVLLMDHHCPWINACVGLHNQRHFVLFMMWLSLGAGIVGVLGYPHFWPSLDFYNGNWKAYTPPVLFTLSWILSIACGSAVLVLGTWHLWMVARGETSIESHDNDYLDKKAKSEGLIYLNPFDLGRRRNLENFFNVGPGGYSKLTLLFPLVVPPYTNGWAYPRRAMPERAPDGAPLLQHAEDRQGPGHFDRQGDFADGNGAGANVTHGYDGGRDGRQEDQHEERLVGDGPGGMYIMGGGDELTDDEGGGGGWWDEGEGEGDGGRDGPTQRYNGPGGGQHLAQ